MEMAVYGWKRFINILFCADWFFFMAEDYNGKETPELPTIHSSLWAKFHFIVTFYIFRVYYFENEYFYYFEISDANKE